MERFLWICLAGAAGTGARYLIALWAAQRLDSAFPYGTLLVNLVGCFAIAGVMHAAYPSAAVRERCLPPLLLHNDVAVQHVHAAGERDVS
jgi:fluoride ion exporter CrcB/FEX